MISSGSHTGSGNAPGRRGFTLVEVLIAVGIIGLLMTIMIMAIVPALESARINATKVTINQINDVIQQRIDAINQADLTPEIKRLTSNSTLNAKQAEFILRKNLYRQALPQTVEDLFGMSRDSSQSLDNSPIYTSWQSATPMGPSSFTADDPYHSSEVLYYALVHGSNIRLTVDGRGFNVPLLDPDTINRKHIKDTDGNGFLEFIDDWGQPLQFYNFPTRLIRPGGTSLDLSVAQVLISGLPSASTDPSNPLNQDPHDPTGIISGGAWTNFNVQVRTPFVTLMDLPGFGATDYHDPNTYFVPLLVSMGPDTTLGLPAPTSTTGFDRLCEPPADGTPAREAIFDNITNRQQ